MNVCGFCGKQHLHPTPANDLPYPSPPGFNDTQHDECSIVLAHRQNPVAEDGWLKPWLQP